VFSRGRRPGRTALAHTDAPDGLDADEADDADGTEESAPAIRRRGWLTRPAPREPEDAAPEHLSLKPAAMRGSEAMYGYVVALELVAVSILNLAVTHGKGAPKHPSTGIAVVGLLASIALMGVIRTTHHRLVVPFAAIVAAFFATLPKVPNSLSLAHLFALVLPVVYAFVLTQRQRKASAAQLRAGKRPAASTSGADTRSAAAGGRRQSRRSRRQLATQTGPTKNRRYTPPKSNARRR
jgi:hypothetical protein